MRSHSIKILDLTAGNLNFIPNILRAAGLNLPIATYSAHHFNGLKSNIPNFDQDMLSSLHKKLKTSQNSSGQQYNALKSCEADVNVVPSVQNLNSQESLLQVKFPHSGSVYINYMPQQIQNNIFPIYGHSQPFKIQLSNQNLDIIKIPEKEREAIQQKQNLLINNQDFVSGLSTLVSGGNTVLSPKSLSTLAQKTHSFPANIVSCEKSNDPSPQTRRVASIRFLKEPVECEPIIEKTEFNPQDQDSDQSDTEKEESDTESVDEEYEPEELKIQDKTSKKIRKQPKRLPKKIEVVDKKDDLQIILSLNDRIVEILGYKEIDQSKLYALYLRSDKDEKKFFIKLRRNLSYYKKALKISQQ